MCCSALLVNSPLLSNDLLLKVAHRVAFLDDSLVVFAVLGATPKSLLQTKPYVQTISIRYFSLISIREREPFRGGNIFWREE